MPSSSSATPLPTRAGLSNTARKRLQEPLRRGSFRDVDAARRQLARLSVADDTGQARIDWLIDLDSMVVEDARFLAFGTLASHPLADLWCERALNTPLEVALSADPAALAKALRDQPDTPAFGVPDETVTGFISELQTKASAAKGSLTVLPKPIEVERYQRKREADWDTNDQAWLPLSLMKKIMRLQAVGAATLTERFGVEDDAWDIQGLHDDFNVIITYTDAIPGDQRDTATAILSGALRNEIHPALTVEEAEA